MEKLNLKLCKFCLKERQETLFYRITRKHYKHTPICNYCYPQYSAGKKLDKVKHVWIGKRKIIEKKQKFFFGRDPKLIRELKNKDLKKLRETYLGPRTSWYKEEEYDYTD